MTTSISSLRDYHYGQPRIGQRSIRSKQANPTTLADARACLAGYGLTWIISFTARTVVNGADHSRNHALPDFCCDWQLATNFDAHLVRFFGAVRDLRYQQFAAICHR